MVVNLVVTLLSQTQYIKFKIWFPMYNNPLWLLEVTRMWYIWGRDFLKTGDGVPHDINQEKLCKEKTGI